MPRNEQDWERALMDECVYEDIWSEVLARMSEEEAKQLKRKLFSEADLKGLRGPARDAYVYGSMRRAGWRPKREGKR